AEPVSQGVNALDNPPKNSKAERAAEKAAEKKAKREAKREAKRQKNNNESADEEIAAVKPAPLEERSAREERRAREDSRTRRGRNAVPDEVIAEVERATRQSEDRGH